MTSVLKLHETTWHTPPPQPQTQRPGPFCALCGTAHSGPTHGKPLIHHQSSAVPSWMTQPELCSSFITSMMHRRVCGVYHCTIAVHLPGCPELGSLEGRDKVSYTFVWPVCGTGPSAQLSLRKSAIRERSTSEVNFMPTLPIRWKAELR